MMYKCVFYYVLYESMIINVSYYNTILLLICMCVFVRFRFFFKL